MPGKVVIVDDDLHPQGLGSRISSVLRCRNPRSAAGHALPGKSRMPSRCSPYPKSSCPDVVQDVDMRLAMKSLTGPCGDAVDIVVAPDRDPAPEARASHSRPAPASTPSPPLQGVEVPQPGAEEHFCPPRGQAAQAHQAQPARGLTSSRCARRCCSAWSRSDSAAGVLSRQLGFVLHRVSHFQKNGG